MNSIYTDNTYSDANPSWHEEDSPWKAEQISQIINKNKLALTTVAEIGCGVGEVLVQLKKKLTADISYTGWEIAPEAYERAKKKEGDGLAFRLDNLLHEPDFFDLLLVIDVIEHIPDHWNFAKSCKERAKYKIYHIPLEVNVQTVLRASFAFTLDSGRNNVGHLHFFTAESALMLLHETGHRIIDTAFTNGGVALANLHPSFKRTLANGPRRLVSTVSDAWAARLFGGYSLLVLCE